MTDSRNEALALLALRLGLAWFLFVWAVNKLLCYFYDFFRAQGT